MAFNLPGSGNNNPNQGGGQGGGRGGFGGGRLGIVGLVIVALIALYFGVDPRSAIALFNGNSGTSQMQNAPVGPAAPPGPGAPRTDSNEQSSSQNEQPVGGQSHGQ